MEIIRSSTEDKKIIYFLTAAPLASKMQTQVDTVLKVSDYAFYNDVNKKTGEVMEVLALTTPTGEVFKTISPTFKEDFCNMLDIFDMSELTIKVISGKSNAGREYITCVYAG